PEAWTQAREDHRTGVGKQLGSFQELFGDGRWRSRAILGVLLAFAGVVGLWGIGFFTPDLQAYVFRPVFQHEAAEKGLSGPAPAGDGSGRVSTWSGWTSLLLNIGAAFGIFAFAWLTPYFGRRWTFALAFVAAAASTILVFWKLSEFNDVFWMIPLMGICQLALFGGYAIYFPELFPTRLRATGTPFCYNVGRLVAAVGPAALGLLTSQVYSGFEHPWPFRYAGITMCAVFLIGLAVLPFLPETKDKPLPEGTYRNDHTRLAGGPRRRGCQGAERAHLDRHDRRRAAVSAGHSAGQGSVHLCHRANEQQPAAGRGENLPDPGRGFGRRTR